MNRADHAIRLVPKSETDEMKLIMIALSADGHFVARANVGLFYTKDGRPCTTGLPNGFSDLFGHRAQDCKAFYAEVKKVGCKNISKAAQQQVFNDLRVAGAVPSEIARAAEWMALGAKDEQVKFLHAMRRRGAIAGVVRSVQDARELLASG